MYYIYIPFYSHCMHVEAIMLISDQELAGSADIKLTSFYTSCEMTIKPINRTIGGTIVCRFTPWYCIINQKIIIQNSQVIKKKLNLKEPFWLISQGQIFSQTCCFWKMIAQNNIYKSHFQRNLVTKLSKKKKFIGPLLQYLQINQDAVTLTFIL